MKKINKNLLFGAGFFILLIILISASALLTPYGVTEININDKLSAPSVHHFFGTDKFGRDIFTRIMAGGKIALFVGVSSVGIGLSVGSFLGMYSGYIGGKRDEVIMRIVDAFMSFPGILFALMMITAFGSGTLNTIFVIGIMNIPHFTRLARGETLKEKEKNYTLSAKMRGAGRKWILVHYIFPNIRGKLIVAAALGFGISILTEASLSYLGLGVQAPYPSWGSMLRESQIYFMTAPWYAVFPGIFITLTIFSSNLLGEYFREKYNSKG
ncbi:ABC transporter permease [Fusobacterium perfoetens]|uniref:ABC transporter permease n=1 Tax=Fusobacterium perfoetens TaxID=852 RepID=UPI001F369597|nr:ABC transporter permease [Fusobacterium perfoetens]MCF2626404.1 ABC transporter permease [Fusobacterium perfoetens]